MTWHHVTAVDLHAAFYLARAVVPGMKERRRGSIIALGGRSSVTSRANTAAVTTAKHGLLEFMRALAAELARSAFAPTRCCRVTSTRSVDTPSGIRSSGNHRRARASCSSGSRCGAGSGRGHRGGVPLLAGAASAYFAGDTIGVIGRTRHRLTGVVRPNNRQ